MERSPDMKDEKLILPPHSVSNSSRRKFFQAGAVLDELMLS